MIQSSSPEERAHDIFSDAQFASTHQIPDLDKLKHQIDYSGSALNIR